VTTFYLDGVSWAIDPWEEVVGHLQGTAWLNQTGNVVIGGHSEMPDGTAGIFHRLYNVGIGDEVFLQDADLTRRYIVVNILSVDYRELSVVYPTTQNRLTLITCDIPSYVAEQNIYYERLVIVADEVPL
jgi:LPXTG-site transpeptidase (sortase) family protein